jgi:hypothetical protein
MSKRLVNYLMTQNFTVGWYRIFISVSFACHTICPVSDHRLSQFPSNTKSTTPFNESKISTKMMLPNKQSKAELKRSLSPPELEGREVTPKLNISSSFCPDAVAKQQAAHPLRAPLGPHDVLCGRTSTAFNNAGNKWFRAIMAQRLSEYIDAPTRHGKSILIRQITSELRNNAGARFLKKCHKTGAYVELGDKPAREKVGHALRDMAAYPGLQQQNEKQQQQQRKQQQQQQQQPTVSTRCSPCNDDTQNMREGVVVVDQVDEDLGASLDELFALFENMKEEEEEELYSSFQDCNFLLDRSRNEQGEAKLDDQPQHRPISSFDELLSIFANQVDEEIYQSLEPLPF